MIKYSLKDNFCVYHSGPVAFHSGPDAKKRPAAKALLANQIASFSWIKNKNMNHHALNRKLPQEYLHLVGK